MLSRYSPAAFVLRNRARRRKRKQEREKKCHENLLVSKNKTSGKTMDLHSVPASDIQLSLVAKTSMRND